MAGSCLTTSSIISSGSSVQIAGSLGPRRSTSGRPSSPFFLCLIRPSSPLSSCVLRRSAVTTISKEGPLRTSSSISCSTSEGVTSFATIGMQAVGSSPDLYQDDLSTASVADDTLLVVGPGVLGKLIAKEWFQEMEGSKVIGQTKTTNNHEGLQSLGIVPALKEDQATAKYPYVVFCAPPYGNDDYIGEIRDAAQKWNGEGSLLFTSSSAVFDINDNGPCDEGVAPIVAKGSSPRTDRLLSAEEEVLKVGGNVVRLAGLYTQDRGAHAYWWKLGTVDARPDHILNLIHYEDAASLCVAILKAKTSGQTFVGCDATPLSRREIMDLTAKSGKFDGEFKGFSATSGLLGKKMSNNITREALGWQPKYGSFGEFLESLP